MPIEVNFVCVGYEHQHKLNIPEPTPRHSKLTARDFAYGWWMLLSVLSSVRHKIIQGILPFERYTNVAIAVLLPLSLAEGRYV